MELQLFLLMVKKVTQFDEFSIIYYRLVHLLCRIKERQSKIWGLDKLCQNPELAITEQG